MADHARSDGDDGKAVVDLSNDDAWQARLEEARARREIALREKAKEPAKPKLKPWELEAEGKKPIEPVIQASTDDRVDFADRLDAIKKTSDENGADEVNAPAASQDIEAELDEIFASEPAPEAEFVSRKTKPTPSLVNEDAPDVIELASRFAAPQKSILDEVIVEKQDLAAGISSASLPIPSRMSRRPFGLAIALIAFSLVPLSVTVPPLQKGPLVELDPPEFVFTPALGLTTAMLWRPATTQVDDVSRAAMPLALPLVTQFAVAPSSPSAAASLIVGFGSIPEGATISSTVSAPFADRAIARDAPGALIVDESLIPLARFLPATRPLPRPGSPDAVTRAPSPLPNLPDNEPSPRVSPVSQQGAALNVSRPEMVSLEPAPDVQPVTTSVSRALNLTILVPSSVGQERGTQFGAEARTQGHTINRVKDVSLNVSTSNIRYFHEADREEALRLGKLYGVEVRDFTWFRPSPNDRTVEVWLEGRARGVPQPVERFNLPEPTQVPRDVVESASNFIDRLIRGVIENQN